MASLTSTVAVAPARYFCFKDFLSEAEAAAFFKVPHAEQVAKVEQYLEFLGQQPNPTQFSASPKATISSAELREDSAVKSYSDGDRTVVLDAALLQQLLDGRTRSGFGAFGTELEFLSQKRLSLAVAHLVEEIGHTYSIDKAPVLNSRSFFFYWCHAEKQKLMDIREKLNAKKVPPQVRCLYWQRIVIVVDRAICDDCVRFVECLARFEQACICIRDPDVTREFAPSKAKTIQRKLNSLPSMS